LPTVNEWLSFCVIQLRGSAHDPAIANARWHLDCLPRLPRSHYRADAASG
jgi:hypothetical protein